jgi:hypothetical protein
MYIYIQREKESEREQRLSERQREKTQTVTDRLRQAGGEIKRGRDMGGGGWEGEREGGRETLRL